MKGNRMTANELADTLQETEPYYSTDYKLFDNAAAMLRQQAERIAELEKLVDELASYKESYENCHRMCNGYGMN
jgi:hypothetical protein